MTTIRVLAHRVLAVFGTQRRDAELGEEIQAHLDLLAEEHLQRGLSRREARAAARREFGGVDQVKEVYRDQRGLPFIDRTVQDVRYALRQLRKHRGFTFAALMTLMLGIGANTAIFSVLHATSLASFAFPDPDRLAMIWTAPAAHPDANEGVSLRQYSTWKERTHAFDQLGAIMRWSSTLGSTEDGVPADRLFGWRFSANMFDALGVRPLLGRVFTAEEDRTDGPANVAVISYRLWQGRFGGDPQVLNRTLLLDGTTTAIIGVMPPNFTFLSSESDFWLPQAFTRFQVQARGIVGCCLMVAGHLRPGKPVQEAQREMNALAAQFAKEYPEHQGRGIRVQLLDEAMFGNVRRLLLVLQGAVGFVLLIACANVAGLFLVRAASQQKEVAIRSSLGANRLRIVRQFLTESLMLSVVGGTLGVLLAWGGLWLLVAASPTWLSQIRSIEINTRVLVFSAVLSVLTGIAFGMVPALQVSRSNLAAAVKESASATGGRSRRRLQSTLVALQIALTLVLLVGAGLLIKSFVRLQRADLGFEPHGLLSFETRLPANKYFRQIGVFNGFAQLDVSPQPAFLFDRVVQRLQELPGVQSAGGINFTPVSGGTVPAPFTIDGRSAADGAGVKESLTANYWLVTPHFFSTMRIPIMRGRDFTTRDTANAAPVAIINNAMARRFWPNEDPLGKKLTVTIVPDGQPREIIAVVGDMPASRWDRTRAPALYVPQLQESLRYRVPYGQGRVMMTFMLRITQPPDVVIPAMRRAVAEVEPSLPVTQVETVDQSLSRQVEAPRDSMVLVGTFGVVALLLAVFGIYGVVAYGIAQRAHEIGIRIALGATSRRIVSLVVKQAVLIVSAGLLLGLVGSFALTRLLAAVLWEVTPTDPLTFAGVALLLTAVTLLASLIPTRRALRMQPAAVLHSE